MKRVFLYLVMVKSGTLEFLNDLSRNNNREWFTENKPRYVDANKDWHEFVQLVIEGMGRFDQRMIGTEAKKCTFRLFRDVRFSKDKTPYKTHFGAFVAPGGRKKPSPGYYVQVNSDKCFCGAGYWHPEKEDLASIRQEIDYNATVLESIMDAQEFKGHYDGIKGDELKLAPKGYPKDHPKIHLLKKKDFIVSSTLDPTEMTSAEALPKLLEKFAAAQPFIKFLNEAIS
ncbi:MAG: hypothetical protein ACJATA_000686 [Sphingobacteriales bacterium]